MVQYKLVYFNGRGAGEVIRQVFAVAEVEYEDFRIDPTDWGKYKDSMPFHQMPVLEVDGKQLPQSFAITRYVANQYGLAGKTAWYKAVVDSLADQWKDFLNEALPFIMVQLGAKPGDLEQLKKDVFIPATQKNFKFFSNYLKGNTSGYLVGDSVSFVDLLLAEFVANAVDKYPDVLEDFPELITHKNKIHSIPQLSKWRANRPVTTF